MSKPFIESLDKRKVKVTPRKTVIISQSLASSPNFTYNFQGHLDFDPTGVIVRQILYTPVISGNDFGTFLIWSSLANARIGALSVGIQGNSQMPESIINITTPSTTQADFRLEPALASYGTPTGVLTLTLEFFAE